MGIGGLRMQDRFKFRVWNKEQQKLYSWDDLLKSKANNSFYWCMLQAQNDEKNNILMQCTGLKDKNGKLIYEGDVVIYDWLTPLGKVWRDDGKHIVEWHDGFTVIGNIAGYDVKHGKTRNVEVIGNIYENPELLED